MLLFIYYLYVLDSIELVSHRIQIPRVQPLKLNTFRYLLCFRLIVVWYFDYLIFTYLIMRSKIITFLWLVQRLLLLLISCKLNNKGEYKLAGNLTRMSSTVVRLKSTARKIGSLFLKIANNNFQTSSELSTI